LALARERRLKQIIYLGDDMTDIDAFRALRAASRRREITSVTVAVVTDESPPGLKESADYWVSSVDEVRRFFEWLAARAARPTS